MKRKIIIIVILLVGLTLLIYGCTHRKETTIKNCGLACEIRFYREKDADINYTIYTDYVYTTTGFYNFLYKVYNDEYIVDEGYEVRETSITRVTSDVLELKLSLGEDPIITRYYSIKNNKKSQDYEDVITSDGNNLIFYNGRLIVRSIFDDSYYKEFNLDINSSDDIYNIKFLDKKIEILYKNSNNEYKKEQLSL